MENYKEKYKQAFERARKIHSETEFDYEKGMMEEIFPELIEDKSEKIRKELIDYVNRLTASPNNIDKYNTWIAWLEKQGELNNNDTDILNRFSFYSYKDEPNILYLSELYVNKEQRNKGIGTKILKIADEVAANMKCNSIRLKTEIGSNAERLYRKNGYNSLKMEGNHIWLEKQCKQPTDKVEQKFKVGDWVILNDTVAQILDKQEYGFVGLDTNGKYFFCNYGHTDSMRLWSINDARDGDVLTFHDEYIFIYNNTCILQAYCYYHTRNDKFYVEDRTHHHKWVMSEVYPATKEQQDMLFEKIKNAGYEWNTAKKKLKKIKL